MYGDLLEGLDTVWLSEQVKESLKGCGPGCDARPTVSKDPPPGKEGRHEVRESKTN